MAVSYGSAGALAYSSQNGSSVAPAYPTVALGNLLVLVIGMKPATANGGSVTTPSGWTPLSAITGAGGYGTTTGADIGNTNLYAYYKTATGSETGSLTVTVSDNNVCWAQIIKFTNATGGWSVANATGSDSTGDASLSISFSSNPGVTAGDFVLGAVCIPTDVTTPSQFTSEAFTQTGVTYATATEISEPDSSTGNDIGGMVCYSSATSGTSSANPSMTATAASTYTNVRGPGIFIRVREGEAPVKFIPRIIII